MPYRSGGRDPGGADYEPPGRRSTLSRSGSKPGSRKGLHGWRQVSLLAKIGYVSAVIIAITAMVASLGAYAAYRQLDVNKFAVGDLTGRSVYGALNILVLGSQTRLHQGRGYGENPSAITSNSDNLLLVHLDPTHTHAIVLSIPRNTYVYEPGCLARRGIGYGIWGPYQSTIIDGALNIGGPTCAVKTVTDFTGVGLDHFVEFNFNSFKSMVDTFGGVQVCIPRGGYHDPYSKLYIKGGRQTVTGVEALALVRTREGVGNGGDLGRIELQQEFIAALVQKIKSQGTLGHALELYDIAKTAAQALLVDKGMGSASKMIALARSLVHLQAKNVNMITMPTIIDPADSNELLPAEPQDDILFQMITAGQRWNGHLPMLRHDKVQVRVLNGTGIPHLARRTAAELTRLGFDVIGTGNAAPTATSTVNYSGTAQAEAAYTVMNALTAYPAAQNTLQEPAPQVGAPGPVTLVLGADFAGVKPPPAQASKRSKGRKAGKGSGSTASAAGQPGWQAPVSASQAVVETRNAAANLCSGLPPARAVGPPPP